MTVILDLFESEKLLSGKVGNANFQIWKHDNSINFEVPSINSPEWGASGTIDFEMSLADFITLADFIKEGLRTNSKPD